MAKSFESLYAETDMDGTPLDWEWDPEEQVFRATDESMRVYTLTPTFGDLVCDDSEMESPDEED